MKTKTTTKPNDGVGDPIDGYNKELSAGLAAICLALRAEIDAALPAATSKIWHGSPVWFIGENPVAGYNAAAKNIKLLFWSGQSFGEPALKPVGKFAAAQIQFSAAEEIDLPALRRWLKKARTDIWDYQGHFAQQRAARKK